MSTTENPNQQLSQLPDDIVHRILRLLPTKTAVPIRLLSNQFDDLWSIDLDEGNPLDMDHHHNYHQHAEFINFSETSLDSRKSDKHVDKFRLRMRYFPQDSAVVSSFLGFAFKRNVMDLDVSLRSKPGVTYYTLSSGFLEQNYLTSLNLEYVRMSLERIEDRSIKLPLLRTLSFKSVVLDSDYSLSLMVSSCPKLENLSLNFKDITTADDKNFGLSVEILLDLKGLTTLYLESLNISDSDGYRFRQRPQTRTPRHLINGDGDGDVSNLPLKSISLKTVHLNSTSFSILISRCPSLEYLSLSSCIFPRGGSSVQFSSSSLKTMQVTDLNAQQLNVDEATNLESFTLVPELPQLGAEIGLSELPQLGAEVGQLNRIALHGCQNLKHVTILSDYVETIVLGRCQDCVGATIDTPNLRYFNFSGKLKSTLCIEAPKLWDATITYVWRDFPTSVNFLKTFGHSKRIFLNIVDDGEVDFVVPESLRNSVSCPPLPGLKNLVVYRKEKLKERDSDLRNFMLWMAPCAELVVKNK